MTSLVAAQLFMAAGGTGNNQPGGQGQEFGSSEPVALILLIVLFIGIGFLIRSMSKHLKKVPASFDPPEATEDQPTEARSAEPQQAGPDTAENSTTEATPAAEAEREKQDH